MQSTDLYPLRFAEIIRNYGFGDRRIVREFAKTGLPEGQCIAETWEVCDRPGESSRIINGPLAGQTLHEAIERHGERLLGRAMVRRFGLTFPLLIKFLDATFPLGEQVHPDDQLTAERKLDYFGKTEAWYMLRADPGATAHCGNRPGLTREQLRVALLSGQSRGCMIEQSAAAGDAFLLRAGTMHYSRGGVLFYEVQQNSNVWVGLGPMPPELSEEERSRRADDALRAVHLEDGIDCRTRPVALPEGNSRRTFIVACEHFALERMDLVEPWRLAPDGQRFLVLSQVEGASKVTCGPLVEVLHPGQTCLVPAEAPPVCIEPQGPGGALLKSYVPDLPADVIRPLRSAGAGDDQIVALGGRSRDNVLGELVRQA